MTTYTQKPNQLRAALPPPTLCFATDYIWRLGLESLGSTRSHNDHWAALVAPTIVFAPPRKGREQGTNGWGDMDGQWTRELGKKRVFVEEMNNVCNRSLFHFA